jgi:hypothetical protein
MKKIPFLLLIVFSISSYSQFSVIADEIAERVLQKALTRAVPKEALYIFSNSEKNLIFSSLRKYGVKLPANGTNFFYQSGKLYQTNYLPMAIKEYDGIERGTNQDPDEHPYENKNKEQKGTPKEEIHGLPVFTALSRLVTFYSNNLPGKIGRIQAILVCLGYDIKIDGIYGKLTKDAIKGAFGIDCSELTFEETYARIYLMFHQNTKATNPGYQLTIKESKTGREMEDSQLSETDLNKHLDKFNCKPDEVCLGIGKMSGEIKFSCTNDQGIEVDISISHKISVDLSLNLPDGSNTKFTVDSNGKVKLTTSDKHDNIRGVTNK